MNCKKCGSPLSLDSKFCNVCGTKVESDIEGDNKTVESPVTPEVTNVVNPLPITEEVKPTETPEVVVNQNNEQPSLEQKEVVSTPEPTVSNQASVVEASVNNVTPIPSSPTPVVESQNVVNNNVSTMQTQDINNQMIQQNNQPVVNNSVPNNPIPNNMNNSTQSKKKTPVGLIIGLGVGAVFIIAIIFILILTGGIKFNATIKSGGTTKQIIGNKTTTSTTTSNRSTTSRVTTNAVSNNNNSSKPINAFDALLKLYTGDDPTDKTYEQVVAIIGEGVKDENYSLPKYIWKQDDNTQLSIVFYSSGKIMDVEIEYDKRDDLKDSNVNLAGAQVISKNINDQVPVYYDDIKTSFGNEGRLYGFSKNDYKYVWVSESGGYVEARFERETNKCLSFFGRV